MFDDYVPADEEHLLQLRGLSVCVIMDDGTRYYGTLTGCSKDKVTLNGDLFDDPIGNSAPKTRTKSRRNSRSSKRVRANSKSGPKKENLSMLPEPPAPEGQMWGLGFDEPIARTKVTLPLEPIQAVLLL